VLNVHQEAAMSDPRDQRNVRFAADVDAASALDGPSSLLADMDAPIDDCWNRIGVRGDGSCPRLAGYIHCRNCPVHDAAAARVLDREQSADAVIGQALLHRQTAQSPSEYATREVDVTSWLVFRIGDEWLGLPTTIFQQVAQLRPIHSLPHRRHRAVLGVVNVRGTLLVCASLARLFGIASVVGQDGRRPEQQSTSRVSMLGILRACWLSSRAETLASAVILAILLCSPSMQSMAYIVLRAQISRRCRRP
jgi:chemotaxis-related protein WspD